MNNYADFLTMVSTEFHRYLMENEKLKVAIPANALIIFQIDGENGFNDWHKKISLKNREINQPIIYVNVKKWRRYSSIEEISLAEAA
ncbi:MAG: hypothetical protein HZA78_09990 [Candidatus Schekmanbacteria bacterium]|nr:hypothetical protein [Candidatus Schekmanbacteria bacterium]